MKNASDYHNVGLYNIITLDYAERDKYQRRIIEVCRITQMSDYAGSTVLSNIYLPSERVTCVATRVTFPIPPAFTAAMSNV